DLAATTGGPDACTDCHADQTPGWAAAEAAKHHPNAGTRPHFGVALAAGRANPVAAQGDLRVLALDETQPGLIRATALWLLSQGADASAAEEMAPLLDHEDPLIRAAAIAVQQAAPPHVMAQRVGGLLDDPERMVRIEAAKAMLTIPPARLPQDTAAGMRRAMSDWQGSLQARIDIPETHLVLGGMALTLRNFPAAKGAFQEVVRMDPQREDAWVMLARITAAVDGSEATLAVLDEALQRIPDSPALTEMRASIRAQ
ncbi:MAG: hypothetical protein MPJ51_21700, partial [Ruegeria sp.]|nr:hypothetical protein [Ruegeria sp.]